MGPENLTSFDLAQRLTQALNHPVTYRQSTLDDLKLSMLNAGLSEAAAQELVLTMQALGDPNGIYAFPRTHETLTPTTIEEFVRNSGLGSTD
jgi:hypothetical protein